MSRDRLLQRATFGRVAASYTDARPDYPHELIADLFRTCDIGPGARVLEVGPGTGQLTLPLAKTGARILAVELSEHLASVARDRLSGYGNVDVQVADFDSWTVPTLAFDVVVAATSFHWLDPESRARRCHSALRPGGRLAVVDTRWGVLMRNERDKRMAYTLWTFIALSDGTVERYPQTRHQKFFDGELPIGVDVGDAARFVEMALETQKGHPLRMLRVWFTRYELTPEGFLSAEHKGRMMHDAVSAVDVMGGTDRDQDVVSLEPFIAQRRNQREHSWQPGKSELEEIVATINDNAAKELVRTDGVTLIAV